MSRTQIRLRGGTSTVRRLPSITVGLLNKPILVSQALSSATGALSVVLGVAWMTQSDYALFAVFNLAANSIFGFVRVVVFQPALIHFRTDKNAFTPTRYMFVAGFGAAAALFFTALILQPGEPFAALILGASIFFPVGQDWLRYRCLVVGKTWRTAFGEAARLAATVVILSLATGSGPAAYQSFANLACAAAIAVQLGGHVRTRRWTAFREYRSAALLQSTDYVVGTLNSIVPMLILGSIGGGALIGGFRLAQTIFGPLNLLFSAAATKMLADGAVQEDLATDQGLVRSGRALALRMALLSGLVVGVGSAVVAFTGIGFSGVSHDSLLIGILCVGAVAVTSGWAGIHNVVMRMLGHNRRVTLGRAAVVCASWLAFAVGFASHGVDGSLIAGFAMSALMYPLAFVLPARVTYSRMIGDPHG